MSTEITIASSQSLSLAAAILDNMKFVSEAMLSSSSYSMRRATWATGNNAMWAANGKTPLENARGFVIDKPNEDELFPEDYELLDGMESLCVRGQAREVVVERLDKESKAHRVPSWQLLEASLFVVCEGVPSELEMRNDPECRWGVAYAPYRTDGFGKSQSSEVHFTAFVKELMDTCYHGPFTFKFSSYVAPKMLACLKAHEYSLRFVNALRADAGEKQGLPFYGLALPVAVSAGTLTAGNAEKTGNAEKKGGTKQVHYPVPAIPRLSRNNPEAALSFLASVAITQDQVDVIEYNGRVQAATAWSMDFSKRLISGNIVDEAVASGAPIDDAPPYTDDDIPESLR